MTESGVASDLSFSRLSNILASQEQDTSSQTNAPYYPSPVQEPELPERKEWSRLIKGTSSQRRRGSDELFLWWPGQCSRKGMRISCWRAPSVQKPQKNLQRGKNTEVWSSGRVVDLATDSPEA